MKVLYDTNILLNVFQYRQPHYATPAKALNCCPDGSVSGYFAAHAVPTIDYILNKYADRTTARESITWLLGFLHITLCDKQVLENALTSPMIDFEDAVVAYCAERESCEYIITRNSQDFVNSPVTALSPIDFLSTIQGL